MSAQTTQTTTTNTNSKQNTAKIQQVAKPKNAPKQNAQTQSNSQSKTNSNKHTHTQPPLAIHCKIDEDVKNFTEAIEFYKIKFSDQIKNNVKFIKNKLEMGQYIIDSRTGYVQDSYMMRHDYNLNENNCVSYKDGDKERNINMAKYLLKQDFCDEIVAHYNKHGIDCKIFDTGYDQKSRRYRNVNLKFSLA